MKNKEKITITKYEPKHTSFYFIGHYTYSPNNMWQHIFTSDDLVDIEDRSNPMELEQYLRQQLIEMNEGFEFIFEY